MPLLCYTLPILAISILCDPLPRPFLSRLCRCHSVRIHSSPCLGLSMQFLLMSTPGISLHCPLVATPRYSSALPDYSLLIRFNTALCHISAYQCHGCSNLIFSFPSQCFSMPCLRYSLLCISFPLLYFTSPFPSVTVHLQANQCRFFEMPPEGLFSGGTADLFSRTAHTEPLRPVCWASGGPGIAPADAFRLLIISICHTAHVCRPALFFHPPPAGIRTSPARHRGVSRFPPSPAYTDSDIP